MRISSFPVWSLLVIIFNWLISLSDRREWFWKQKSSVFSIVRRLVISLYHPWGQGWVGEETKCDERSRHQPRGSGRPVLRILVCFFKGYLTTTPLIYSFFCVCSARSTVTLNTERDSVVLGRKEWGQQKWVSQAAPHSAASSGRKAVQLG